MTKRAFFWLAMTLLAFAVSGYAGAMLVAPDIRPSLVQTLFSERPVAAFGHFLGGAIALAAGALQLNATLRSRFVRVHRWLGRLYVLAVLVGGTSGLFMALYSMGGTMAHVGFGLLAVCWLGATLLAYLTIRQGNLDAHRGWMIRSYALTLAAVTLRLYIPASQVSGLSMAMAYPVIAWLCWLPNLALAEWFVRSRRSFAMFPGK